MKHRLLPTKCEMYHGKESTRPYFEGWYFKHVSKDADFEISVICGVSRSENPLDDHSFIQIITGPEHRSHYIKFSYEDFRVKQDIFFVAIGSNTFSMDKIHLDIDASEIKIKADLSYSGHIKLENNIYAPSVMGPFSYLPNMECNHGVLSLKNMVSGRVELDGILYEMDGGTGYIEKDWGEAFPNAWIWLQGNMSQDHGTAFMCSVASIPYGPFNFTGLICVLHTEKRQYRFATYNGSKIIAVNNLERGVEVILKKGKLRLEIKASSERFDKLIGPTRNGMDRILYESISGEIDLMLYENDKQVSSTRLLGCGMEVSEIGDLVK